MRKAFIFLNEMSIDIAVIFDRTSHIYSNGDLKKTWLLADMTVVVLLMYMTISGVEIRPTNALAKK